MFVLIEAFVERKAFALLYSIPIKPQLPVYLQNTININSSESDIKIN